MRLTIKATLLVVVLSTGLVGCTSAASVRDASTPPPTASAAPTARASPAGSPEAASLKGAADADSFGNVDFYTTVDGDTLATVAAAFGISTAKLAQFNQLQAGDSAGAGTRLRLIPAPGPIAGAQGASN